jgi:tetratricopeptide (TPR) repeat protein
MMDYQFFGLNPFWHHLVSLLFHTINVLLLFWLLIKMTGATWPSAFVAAVFALHPLQVESVAWASERKTVLSGLFWLLTLIAYVHYTRQPQTKRYLLLLVVYGLCIMTKPVVVTLPFVLLLLDYWPLGRFKWGRHIETLPLKETGQQEISVGKLIIEKIPLLALSAILSIITFLAQREGSSISPFEKLSLDYRIANMFVSYISYVGKIIWPNRLAVLYPYSRTNLSDAKVIICALLFILISISCIYMGRHRRYIAVGWLWFVGTLVPVIGLVQSGSQAMADRYAYLPSIGVFLIIAWGAEEIFTKVHYPRMGLLSVVVASLITMVLMTRIQVGYWRDSSTLCEHTLAVTKNNIFMLNNYGTALCRQGRYEKAMKCFEEAVRIKPDYLSARWNICVALLQQNKIDEVISRLSDELQKRKDWPEMYLMYGSLAWAYGQKGNLAMAETNYRKALTLKPNYEPALNDLGMVYIRQGKLDEAIACFNAISKPHKDAANIYYGLATALNSKGRYGEAAKWFAKVLELNPEYQDVHYQMGTALLAAGRFEEAIPHLNEALQTSTNTAKIYVKLGTAYTQMGKYKSAIENWTKVLALDPNNVDTLNNVAWLMATVSEVSVQDANKAIELSERACELTKYKKPGPLDTLAAAYAAAGRFDDAMTTAQQAIDAAKAGGREGLADEIQNRMKLYQAGRRYHQK